ncbi:MAG TPA: sigma-70 family RNA polymerase sigma factor [Verrucomicrobiae bacterium]|nr:sigma-70 family RNA polymerase sigma factor [Verrucomicrobiae bacterium]
MQAKSDAQLLRDYAEQGTEASFTELVNRHTNLVYSAAFRQVNSHETAAEIAQSAFIGLARGARSLAPRLAAQASLTGWLCRSARNLSLNFRRDEVRRRMREREAMEQLNSISDTAPDSERLRPVLDTAMSELNETDFDALVLRFLKNQDLRSVGSALGVSDDTAQKRVARALEKLREHLARHGINTTAAALSTVISANAVQAAPPGLAASISTAAVLAGTTLGTTATTTAIKTIAMTTLQKPLVTAALVVLAGTGLYESRQTAKLREQNETLQQQHAPLVGQIRQLQSERDDATNLLAALLAERKQWRSEPNDTALLRLRGEVTRLRKAVREGTNDVADVGLAEAAARISQTKEWLKQTPAEKIPELDLIDVSHWVNYVSAVPKWQGTSNDFELVLGSLRTEAKEQFAMILGGCLDNYLVANGGQLPTDLSELKPYLMNWNNRATHYGIKSLEINDAMLQRYQLLATGNVSQLAPSEPLVSEKLPINNAQYDGLFKIGTFNFSYTAVSPIGSSGSGPIIAAFKNNALKQLFGGQ